MAESKDTLEKSVEDLEKEITCAICHDHYTDPKVLPCCHYYCKQCIHSLALRTGINKPFYCPECRKTTTLPEGGMDNLPTAFFINRMKAMHSNMERAHGKVEAKCEMCSGDKSEAFCRQCAMFICAECVKHHKKLKVFAGHKTSTLDELKVGGAKDILPKPTLPICKLHDEPLKFYCFDCSCLICRDCTVEDHLGHKYKSIKTAAPDARKGLIQQLDPLKKAMENLTQAVAEIQTTESEVEAQGHSIADSVNQAFDELETIIRNRRQEMLKEAAVKVSDKLERLSVQRKGLSMSSAVVQSVIDYTEQCVEHSADDEVMSMLTEIQSRIDREIEEQQKEGKNLEPVEEADMGVEVSCAEDLKQLCQTKASITQLDIDCAVTVLSAEVNKMSELRVTAKLSNGKPTKRSHVVECSLKRLACDSITACKVEGVACGEYRVQYTPTVRGHHDLTVTVNGRAMAGSPFSVFVSIPPTQLGKPLQVISNLTYSRDISVNSKSGELVVAYDRELCLLDRKGEKLRSFEKSSSSERFLGIATDTTNNHVYAISKDSIFELVKLSPDLELLHQCEVYQESFVGLPVGVEVVGDEVMVCDEEKNCVKVYTKNLEFVREIGRGSEMKSIRGLSSDKDGNLYVCDYGKNCILVFSNAGDFLKSFDVQRPRGVCVAGEHLYVTIEQHKVFVLLRTTGQQVTSFGQRGGGEGEFNCPFGVCVDKDGFVCVCDYHNHRVQVF